MFYYIRSLIIKEDMQKLIKYIFTLILILSFVHFTKGAIEFSKEIIMLKDFQSSAKIKQRRMMHPTVKVTSLAPFGSDESGSIISLSSATGFSVKYNIAEDYSVIVTNDHFCNTPYPEKAFIVEDYKNSSVEKSGVYLTAEIIITKPELDLCLLKAKGYVKPATIAQYSYVPEPFEEIFVVGGPSGTFPIIFDTYVSKVIKRKNVALGNMDRDGNDLLLISEQVFPGHSGSPIFTKDGEVIGVVFGALRSYGGLGISNRDIYLIMELAGE